MTAVEVLQWLKENNHIEDDSKMYKLFGDDCVCGVLQEYEPQEIVAKIEKYEADKNKCEYAEQTNQAECIGCIDYSYCTYSNKLIPNKNNGKDMNVPSEPEFKVGDWVRLDYDDEVMKITGTERGTLGTIYLLNNGRGSSYACDLKHAEPPKEAKKIEKIREYETDIATDDVVINKINELVNVVNELRGAE